MCSTMLSASASSRRSTRNPINIASFSKIDPKFQASEAALASLYLPSSASSSGQVPLAAIVHLEERDGPLQITHFGQFPATTISFDLAPGVSLGAAVSAIETAQAEIALPQSFTLAMQGAAAAFTTSSTDRLVLIIAAIVTMYIVLGVLYESFVHPITILSTLPSAGVGALLALMATGHDLDVMGVIGIILLIGIVKKNAIMMIDFALEAERVDGTLAARGDLSRLPVALPSDPHDDDGRHSRRCPAAARLGRRIGAAAAARRRHRRRPGLQPDSDALLDARRLSLLRSPGASRQPPRRLRPRRARGGGEVNFSAPFIKRPVATTLLTLGLALAGVSAYMRLPVAPLPKMDFPVLSVSASLPGASPETVATSVAGPLERRLGTIADVTTMTSSSNASQTNIMLQFGFGRDLDGAARDVLAAINAAAADLPAGVSSSPSYRKFNPADAPIVTLALISKSLTRAQLYDAANDILQQRLSQLTGVGQVTVGGAASAAVRVDLDISTLFKYGIGLEDVSAALASANANSPKGDILRNGERWQIYTNDRASRAADYRNLVIAYRNGFAVRLSEVAEVEDSNVDLRNAAIARGEPAVLVTVFRQPGANIIETVDRIEAQLPKLAASLPNDVELIQASDRSTSIRASLADTELTLALAVVLVVGVVYLFVGDWRATLVPAVAVPVSIVGAFIAMDFLGYSLNILSLMALTIATGFVVDDAIVVLENIQRHSKMARPRARRRLAARARSASPSSRSACRSSRRFSHCCCRAAFSGACSASFR